MALGTLLLVAGGTSARAQEGHQHEGPQQEEASGQVHSQEEHEGDAEGYVDHEGQGEAGHPQGHQAPTVALSEQEKRILGVQSAPAVEAPLHKRVQTVAELTYDPRNVVDVTARVNGEVEVYNEFFEGQLVEEGEVLMELHSPNLIRVAEDYLAGLRAQQDIARLGHDFENLDVTSRVTLLWRGLTDGEIREMQDRGEVPKTMPIESPVTGVVTQQPVQHNSLINAGVRGGQFTAIGDVVAQVARLETMWVQAELLGSQMDRVREGMTARVQVHGLPNRVYEAPVTYVYPDMRMGQRTRIARVVLPNEELDLMPGMYADVEFRVPVEGDRSKPEDPILVTDAEGEAEPVSTDRDSARQRPEGSAATMGQKEIEPLPEWEARPVLSIPEGAVIRTGEGARVFVRTGPRQYQARQVRLGDLAEGRLVVEEGLQAGEEVVVQGQYFLDAEVSMAQSGGGGGHHH
ncbi:hypothetical protein AN478_05950 [Thiohalorhabdus denitrificans]|nr:hypothetical protein AN478_05950 [Thiohalorhabdus denitrificans]